MAAEEINVLPEDLEGLMDEIEQALADASVKRATAEVKTTVTTDEVSLDDIDIEALEKEIVTPADAGKVYEENRQLPPLEVTAERYANAPESLETSGAISADAALAANETVGWSPEELEEVTAEESKPKSDSKFAFYIDVANFQAEMSINEVNLDQAMMEQASKRVYYATQAAHAEAQHDRTKARFDVLEAKLYDEHRKALATAGEKVTEKMVENAVKLDPRWLAGKTGVIEAESIANIHRNAVVRALDDRKDMLIQLSADRRKESDGQLRMMEKNDDLTERSRNAARIAIRQAA